MRAVLDWSLWCAIACVTIAARSPEKHAEFAASRYRVGDYSGALDAYREAYHERPAPELLLRIGECHARLGQSEQALSYFHGFVRERPLARQRAYAEALIEDVEIKASRDRQQVAQVLLEHPLVPPPKPGSTQATLAAHQRDLVEVAPYTQWWFWAAVGGALVTGVVAAGVSLQSSVAQAPTATLGAINAR